MGAVLYAIDQNLAPIISESWGGCEKYNISAGPVLRNMAQQAVAQGITWVASSGDSGAACQGQWKNGLAVDGLAVEVPGSVPEITAVGGTTFVEGAGRYWSPTSSDNGTSALSYIPEKAWNDSAIEKEPVGGGGGVSIIFPRPAWQTAPGLPSDNARHVPDLAFTASAAHDPYLVMQDGRIHRVGGTSAGTPFFAGVLALLNEYVVSSGAQARPGLGNINPRLYQLAQVRGVFHDVTTGDNIVPCQVGTPDCTQGQYGYA